MLARHTFVYFFSHALPAILTFLGITIYTRMLSPEQYGVYSLVMVMVVFINSVLFQWLRLSLLRFYAVYDNDEQRKSFNSTIMICFVTIMFASFIPAFIFKIINRTDEISWSLILLGVVLSWLQSWLMMNLTMFRSKLSPINYGILSFLKAFLTLLFAVFFIYIGFGEVGLIIGLIVGTSLAVLYPTFKFWRGSVSLEKFDLSLSKQFLSYGIPLTITFAMGIIINSSDRVFISWLIGAEATGIYSVAYDFSEYSLLTVMTIVNLAAYPLIVKTYEEKGIEATNQQLKKNASLLMLVAIPSLAGLIILNENISSTLFGNEFSQGVAVLIPWIAIAGFLKGFKLYYVDISYQITKNTKLQAIPVFIGAVINVLLNILLIPLYGTVGAAIATVLAYGVAIIIGVLIGTKIFKLEFPLINFMKITIASIIMSFILYKTTYLEGLVSLMLQIILGILTYFSILLMLYFSRVRGQIRRILNTKSSKDVSK